ncbi:hypothetical protein ACIHFD_49835 [Nonomuraea sp. NPDC051941]|uniref:hypothetical protein n=1 Tax=Nonomuraea sp. NPDC051941 TaxID=3364373 RepID=UPI0037C72FA8
MAVTTITFSDTHTATFHLYKSLSYAMYDFGDNGKVCVQPAYFGCPDRYDVMISLGPVSGPDQSGHGLRGLRVGDRKLAGVVLCTGYDLLAGAHFNYPQRFPLDDLAGQVRDDAADLLSAIAQHFHGIVAR